MIVFWSCLHFTWSKCKAFIWLVILSFLFKIVFVQRCGDPNKRKLPISKLPKFFLSFKLPLTLDCVDDSLSFVMKNVKFHSYYYLQRSAQLRMTTNQPEEVDVRFCAIIISFRSFELLFSLPV